MITKNLRSFFNYQIGKLAAHYKYSIKPSWKENDRDLNPVALAVAALFSNGPLNLVIQIGAFDGDLHDPLQGKILSTARTAILIEPQPRVAAALKERYRENSRIRVLEAAVAAQDGTAILYSDSDFSSKASLEIQHLDRFGKACEFQTTVRTISPQTLVTFADGCVPDLLQIDIEGMDWKILRLFLDAGIRPPIINFEHLHLDQSQRDESRSRIKQEGYSRDYALDTR